MVAAPNPFAAAFLVVSFLEDLIGNILNSLSEFDFVESRNLPQQNKYFKKLKQYL